MLVDSVADYPDRQPVLKHRPNLLIREEDSEEVLGSVMVVVDSVMVVVDSAMVVVVSVDMADTDIMDIMEDSGNKSC